jgi:hypothetical protein
MTDCGFWTLAPLSKNTNHGLFWNTGKSFLYDIGSLLHSKAKA